MELKVVKPRQAKSPYRSLSRHANSSKETKKNFSSPTTNRPFLNRNKSEDPKLNGSLSDLSAMEKRLREDTLLKEVYGVEQRVYNRITKADLLPSINNDILKRRLERPKSQLMGGIE